MQIKNLIDEDFSNYKKCAMFIGFPTCTFKCEKDCGCSGMCQNGALIKSPTIDMDVADITIRYIQNPLSHAIVCGGLEPFDSFPDLLSLVATIRSAVVDDIVIYTGYIEEEIADKIAILSKWKNIIIKFGRYIPNQNPHYDEVLGVYLASPNQVAEKIS